MAVLLQICLYYKSKYISLIYNTQFNIVYKQGFWLRGGGGVALQNVTVILQHFAKFGFIITVFVQILKSSRASWIWGCWVSFLLTLNKRKIIYVFQVLKPRIFTCVIDHYQEMYWPKLNLCLVERQREWCSNLMSFRSNLHTVPDVRGKVIIHETRQGLTPMLSN